jgi:S-adenosylmethionine hydrolase
MITLTTDFGLKDPYVAEMKGVIFSINSHANIVDVTHEVNKFSVRMGAYVLASALPYFSEGAVHVAVVDPGVGTSRRAIVVQTKRACFVGPDNGVLMLAATAQGIKHIYELSNPKFMLPQVSNTFHGRDIFAPAAARLDMGVAAKEFGAEIFDPVTPKFAIIESKDGVLIGEVLHVDGFGNAITNLTQKNLAQATSLKVNFHHVSLQLALAKAYGQVRPQEAIALVGSSGFMEVALNQGSFAEKFRVNAGDKVEVELETP